MFYTLKEKSDLSKRFRELEDRIQKLEANAEKHGYRLADGVPKKLPGRPRKEAAK
jgi:hypothetical protein